jgi:adenylylsulfate kinase
VTGAIVWFTGLPASGKTTLARRVQESLGRGSLVLDSDALRDMLDSHGHDAEHRDRFYAQLGGLARLVAGQGLVALVAATAPRREHRDAARASGQPFTEVWVRTPLEDCERRDPKGLYAAARRGEMPALPGVGASYEPPLHPEVIADGGHDDTAVADILARLAIDLTAEPAPS